MQNPQTPIGPDTPMNVTLPAHQWNAVMVVLQETPSIPLPNRIVSAIVQALSEQLQAQAAQFSLPANGVDAEARH
jgi:hypothetical protein